MKFYFYTLIAALLFFGCENSNSSQSDYAFFGGEIINPSNNYITFNNSTGSKDTIYLDSNNRFIHKVDSLKPDTCLLAYARFNRRPYKREIEQLKEFLLARTKTDNLRLVTNN